MANSKTKWLTVTAEEASGEGVALSAMRMASEVALKKLTKIAEHLLTFKNLYEHSIATDDTFDPQNDTSQVKAASLLAAKGLDLDARECLENRWSIKWTKTTGSIKERTKRVLFQW